ncbi:MAG: hypothetical protein IPK93_01300 [Solirubrobacterales bacterium]|nr:hypothetical protein [Solirubrobacterales bacterium]
MNSSEAVNTADVDYLVTSPYLNFNDYERPIHSPEKRWVESDPALTRIGEPGQVDVWRVEGELDPATCDTIGPNDEFVPGLKDDPAQ